MIQNWCVNNAPMCEKLHCQTHCHWRVGGSKKARQACRLVIPGVFSRVAIVSVVSAASVGKLSTVSIHRRWGNKFLASLAMLSLTLGGPQELRSVKPRATVGG